VGARFWNIVLKNSKKQFLFHTKMVLNLLVPLWSSSSAFACNAWIATALLGSLFVFRRSRRYDSKDNIATNNRSSQICWSGLVKVCTGGNLEMAPLLWVVILVSCVSINLASCSFSCLIWLCQLLLNFLGFNHGSQQTELKPAFKSWNCTSYCWAKLR